MNCENELCIYFNNYKCTLKKINLNDIGLCEACITVSFDTDELARKRKKDRDKLDKIHAEWDEK